MDFIKARRAAESLLSDELNRQFGGNDAWVTPTMIDDRPMEEKIYRLPVRGDEDRDEQEGGEGESERGDEQAEKAEWREEDHPRDERGRFTEKPDTVSEGSDTVSEGPDTASSTGLPSAALEREIDESLGVLLSSASDNQVFEDGVDVNQLRELCWLALRESSDNEIRYAPKILKSDGTEVTNESGLFGYRVENPGIVEEVRKQFEKRLRQAGVRLPALERLSDDEFASMFGNISRENRERMVFSKLASDTETAFIVKQDGEIVQVEGNENTVPFGPHHVNLMRDGVLIHNHPSGYAALSVDDMLFAMPAAMGVPVKAVVAFSHGPYGPIATLVTAAGNDPLLRNEDVARAFDQKITDILKNKILGPVVLRHFRSLSDRDSPVDNAKTEEITRQANELLLLLSSQITARFLGLHLRRIPLADFVSREIPAQKAEWREEDHPRDERGRFTEKPDILEESGGAGSTVEGAVPPWVASRSPHDRALIARLVSEGKSAIADMTARGVDAPSVLSRMFSGETFVAGPEVADREVGAESIEDRAVLRGAPAVRAAAREFATKRLYELVVNTVGSVRESQSFTMVSELSCVLGGMEESEFIREQLYNGLAKSYAAGDIPLDVDKVFGDPRIQKIFLDVAGIDVVKLDFETKERLTKAIAGMMRHTGNVIEAMAGPDPHELVSLIEDLKAADVLPESFAVGVTIPSGSILQMVTPETVERLSYEILSEFNVEAKPFIRALRRSGVSIIQNTLSAVRDIVREARASHESADALVAFFHKLARLNRDTLDRGDLPDWARRVGPFAAHIWVALRDSITHVLTEAGKSTRVGNLLYEYVMLGELRRSLQGGALGDKPLIFSHPHEDQEEWYEFDQNDVAALESYKKRYRAWQRFIPLLVADQVATRLIEKHPDISMSEARATFTALSSAWEAWVSGSSSDGGTALRRAASRVFGATQIVLFEDDDRRLERNFFETALESGSVRPVLATLDESIDRFQAFFDTAVKASWEVTQYLLQRAGKEEMDLFRAVGIEEKEFGRKRVWNELRDPSGDPYIDLPELQIRKHALQSTSGTRDVPNRWRVPFGKRVVLSMRVPREAVISLPPYGDNTYEEEEVVVLGVPWLEWHAWYEQAPPSFFLKNIRKAEWREEEHPRDERGRFAEKPDIEESASQEAPSVAPSPRSRPSWLIAPSASDVSAVLMTDAEGDTRSVVLSRAANAVLTAPSTVTAERVETHVLRRFVTQQSADISMIMTPLAWAEVARRIRHAPALAEQAFWHGVVRDRTFAMSPMEMFMRFYRVIYPDTDDDLLRLRAELLGTLYDISPTDGIVAVSDERLLVRAKDLEEALRSPYLRTLLRERGMSVARLPSLSQFGSSPTAARLFVDSLAKTLLGSHVGTLEREDKISARERLSAVFDHAGEIASMIDRAVDENGLGSVGEALRRQYGQLAWSALDTMVSGLGSQLVKQAMDTPREELAPLWHALARDEVRRRGARLSTEIVGRIFEGEVPLTDPRSGASSPEEAMYYRLARAFVMVALSERTTQIANKMRLDSKKAWEHFWKAMHDWYYSHEGMLTDMVRTVAAFTVGARRGNEAAIRSMTDSWKLLVPGIRAIWDVTQHILRKANIKSLTVYRAIGLHDDMVDRTNVEEVHGLTEDGKARKFYRLRRVDVLQRGAQSTSLNPRVANEWPTQQSRVVLQITVSPQSVLMLPIFMNNQYNEEEVIITDRQWKSVHAWLGRAPAKVLTRRGKGDDSSEITHLLRVFKYGRKRPMRPPPLDLSFAQLNYTWLLADDEIGSATGTPSCEVCNYLADVGYFRLRDALAQFDILLDTLESGELGEEPGFPTMDDIDGLGVKDLTKLGLMLPPIHPHCRCEIVFI